MIETSQEYKDLITKSGRHFLTKAVVNGKTYSGIKNLSYKGGTNSSDQISVGDAVSAYVEFTLIDTPQGMLTGQTVEPYIGLQLSSSVEWIKLGVFHMDKPKKDGNFLSITAYDNFSLMEKGFFTDLSGNQKIKTILDEQCAKIGISFRGDADDVEYDVSLLEGSTVREAVSILAAYCGKNAIIDRNGNLKFVWYTDCGVTIRSNEYKDTLEYDEEDTFINRLECATNEETLSIGTGVGIFFSCPGMTETRLNELYNRIKGFTYRTIKIDWMIARPDIEAGDLLTVITTDGTQCKVPLMDFEIHCDGGCYGTIESKGKSESEQAHEFKSPTEKKISFVYEETISVKKILVDTINAWNGNFEEIETNYLQVNKKLTALEAEIKDLDVDELTAKVAEIERAYISKAEVEQLYATKAEIGILDTKIANIDKAIIDVAHIDDLEVINARIDNIEAGNIDTDALEAHFARIDLANIKDGCITNAMIGEGVIESAQIADGSITDAKIVTLTANKLTAGRIDASDIEVVNLNCANLTVGTINGKQITNGAIDWDKLASQVGNTINNADENASQALEDALKAYQEAQKANSAAGTAQITANGKNTVIYASAQPSTSGRKTNDIWYDTDDGYKMYYFDGKAWKAAQFGIGAIGDDAITADKIANDVNSKINEAFTNANNALGKANTAQSTADGKNTVYYQASAPPTTGRKTNDVWFDTDDGNKMYYWNGKAWTVQQFGTNAIKALSITNALIADAAINNAKIANLDAAKITTGYLSAARIKAGSLTASMLAVDTITAASGVIADAAILTANIADLAVTSAKIANASIGNAKIADAAITNAKIADAAINNAKIANLDAGKITSGYISSDRIAANSITIGKLDSATQDSINGAARKTYHETVGTSGVSGYFLLAEIKIKQVYSNRPIKISIANRATMSSDVYILFGNANSTDPNIQYFSKNGGAKFYIHKAAASTWNLYVLKSESYDSLAVVDFDGSSYASKISVTWKSTQVSTLPSGYIEAKQLAGMADWCYANNITNIDGSKIYTGTIDAVQIKANAIIAGKIAANAVTTANLQADCVNADKIAAKAINAEHINGAIITGDKIVASAITGDKIAARTIDATKIVANTITAAEIKAGTITGDKIAAGTIDASKIKAGTITATQIAANAITAEKIAANAVTAAKITTDAIKSRNYVANSVGSFLNLADGTFTSKNLKWTSDGSLTGSNVNLTGTITAKYGKIGKFNINDYYLMAGSGSNAAGMSGDQAFWAGGELSNVAPFRVSYDGKLVASNATITGKISGSSISGGTISGASITGGSITSNTTINVSTDLKVGNNVYLNQSVNTTKKIEFASGNMIMNTWTNSYNYLTMRSNYRCALISGNVQIAAVGNTNEAEINLNGGTTWVGEKSFNNGWIGFYNWAHGTRKGWMGHDGGVDFHIRNECNASNGVFLDATANGNWTHGRFAPSYGGMALGSSNNRWYRLYSSNGCDTSSDIRLKTNIKKYDKRYEQMYMELKPVMYELKANLGQTQCGLIAQWVYDAMKDNGIEENEFGAYNHHLEDDSYGLIYEQFTSLNMHMIQKTIKRVDTIDNEIARLKDKVAELQSKLNAYILGEMEVKKA
jgi:hypothetical protein